MHTVYCTVYLISCNYRTYTVHAVQYIYGTYSISKKILSSTSNDLLWTAKLRLPIWKRWWTSKFAWTMEDRTSFFASGSGQKIVHVSHRPTINKSFALTLNFIEIPASQCRISNSFQNWLRARISGAWATKGRVRRFAKMAIKSLKIQILKSNFSFFSLNSKNGINE